MSKQRLRNELIQVAAVAVSIIEDLDYGEANSLALIGDRSNFQCDEILLEVANERFSQDAKWGPQHHDPFTWLLILMEEVGEASDEIPYLAGHPGSGLHHEISRIGRGAQNTLDQKVLPKDEAA